MAGGVLAVAVVARSEGLPRTSLERSESLSSGGALGMFWEEVRGVWKDMLRESPCREDDLGVEEMEEVLRMDRGVVVVRPPEAAVVVSNGC